MSVWTIYSGQVIEKIIYGTEETLDLNLGDGQNWVEGMYTDDEYFIVDAQATERPSLNLPEEYTLLVNQDWNVGTLPGGTAVYIDNVLAGETDDTALTMSFPLAREYAVKFDPPFPYKPSEVKVTVNETNA
jgi:hypothetical protein